MNRITTNRERTEEYLENFNRERLLKLLVNHESPIIFDGRNLYNKFKLKELGFYYSNVGYIPSDD